MDALKIDISRYSSRREIPKFQIYFRKAQASRGLPRYFWIYMLRRNRRKYLCEISHHCKIGGGLYLGHVSGITINPNVEIGEFVNIHKGVTIGQENRGKRKGVPTIGNRVWIGVNATIVGKISIGDDVLIAPNTLVNRDIPSHSIVFGNPCIIKHCENATKDYIQ